ncbi:MAG: hypothetical protein JXA89_22295 [Anaerolineae bacterium]|nr:hypothetical protein [Anaerolineae bacterium]
MSDRIRAWQVRKSFKWALLVGVVAGLATAGLLNNSLIGNMDAQASILAGLGVGVGLTLLLTYVLDRVSLFVGGLGRAIKKRGRKESVGKE